jgi:hypothetical protein
MSHYNLITVVLRQHHLLLVERCDWVIIIGLLFIQYNLLHLLLIILFIQFDICWVIMYFIRMLLILLAVDKICI